MHSAAACANSPCSGDRLASSRLRHTRAMTCITLGLAGLAVLLPAPDLGVQIALAGALVAVVGLPHGAADLMVARRWLRRGSHEARFSRHVFAFLAGYLLFALFALGLCVEQPRTFWPAFLIASIWHFGAGDVESGLASRGWEQLEIWARGALPIVWPATFHPEAVGNLFAMLTGPRAETGLGEAVVWVGARAAPWVAAALVAVCARHAWRGARRGDGRHTAVVLEVVALALAGAVLPPLLFFALYFCGWHSVRHALGLLDTLGRDASFRGLARLARAALVPTLAPLIAAGAIMVGLAPRGLEPAALQVLFAGLAALAVPHMLLWTWLPVPLVRAR